ncbi:MAG: hypothetical protein R3Y12_07805 [Clostridia bacterium]
MQITSSLSQYATTKSCLEITDKDKEVIDSIMAGPIRGLQAQDEQDIALLKESFELTEKGVNKILQSGLDITV